MLSLALACALANPPAGEYWSTILRPAVVVPAEDSTPSVELPEGSDGTQGRTLEAPRLAPAKTLAPKAKSRKVRPSAQAKASGR